MVNGAEKEERAMKGDKASVVAEVKEREHPGGAPEPMEDGRSEKRAEENGVVKGEDAQGAAHIEVANAVRLIARVVQDAGDEKAGEHKEKVDADPSPVHSEVVWGDVVLKENE